MTGIGLPLIAGHCRISFEVIPRARKPPLRSHRTRLFFDCLHLHHPLSRNLTLLSSLSHFLRRSNTPSYRPYRHNPFIEY